MPRWAGLYGRDRFWKVSMTLITMETSFKCETNRMIRDCLVEKIWEGTVSL